MSEVVASDAEDSEAGVKSRGWLFGVGDGGKFLFIGGSAFRFGDGSLLACGLLSFLFDVLLLASTGATALLRTSLVLLGLAKRPRLGLGGIEVYFDASGNLLLRRLIAR